MLSSSRPALPQVECLDSDAEIRTLGLAEITDIGAENVYVAAPDGRRYCFKPGNTDHFSTGPIDLSGVCIFGATTAIAAD